MRIIKVRREGIFLVQLGWNPPPESLVKMNAREKKIYLGNRLVAAGGPLSDDEDEERLRGIMWKDEQLSGMEGDTVKREDVVEKGVMLDDDEWHTTWWMHY